MSGFGRKPYTSPHCKLDSNTERNKKSLLTVYYQNVRGLRTKLNRVCSEIIASQSEVFLLTETWLHSSIMDAELIPSGYNILRHDRPGARRGGGVAIIAAPKYELQPVYVDENSTICDLICAALCVRNNILIVLVCVYIPPKTDEDNYLYIFHVIETLHSKHKNLLIGGDFNLNSANINVNASFQCLLVSCGLQQVNTVVNIDGRTLDLILVTEPLGEIALERAIDVITTPDVYHPPIEIQIQRYFRPKCKPLSEVSSSNEWNFYKADFQTLYVKLALIDWKPLLTINDANQAVTKFYDLVNICIDSCVPIKQRMAVHPRYCYPVWYTPLTRRNIKIKHMYHKLFKKTKHRNYRCRFSRYRALVKLNIKADFLAYKTRMERDILRDPSSFWGYIASKRCRTKGVKKIMANGSLAPENQCAQLFADYFKSIYSRIPPKLNPEESSTRAGKDCGLNIDIRSITDKDLYRALEKIKPKRSAGPDGIPPYIARDCRSVFVEPLLYIYNLCLASCTYPEAWKLSRVVPVPKNSSGSNVSDYRPIAVLSVFGKLFESVLYQLIINQTDCHLSDAQHGFRKGRSTTTNLLSFWSFTTSVVDNGHQVDTAYFDFRRAFDTVDNDVLLHKFAAAGFTPSLLKFFSCYLRNRRQYVQYNGCNSKQYYTYSGIGQGSNLGPLAFLIFINDLPNAVSAARCLLFADDLKLFFEIKHQTDCQLLQRDINSVLDWSKRNKLMFNEDKCSVLTFTRGRDPIVYRYRIGNEEIVRNSSIKDLGVLLKGDLTFSEHISATCAKAYRLLGFVLRQTQQIHSTPAMRMLYNSFVRSILESNAVIWSPHEAKYKLMLEKLQKKFMRQLYFRQYGYFVGYPNIYPSRFLLGMLGYNTLELRRNITLLDYFVQLLRGKVSNPSVLELISFNVPNNYIRARRFRLFEVPGCRLLLKKESPLVRALTLLNGLVAWNHQIDVFYTTTAVFRRAAGEYLEMLDKRIGPNL